MKGKIQPGLSLSDGATLWVEGPHRGTCINCKKDWSGHSGVLCRGGKSWWESNHPDDEINPFLLYEEANELGEVSL